jgi:hypothetical protein
MRLTSYSASAYKSKFAQWRWAKNKRADRFSTLLAAPKLPDIFGRPDIIFRSIRYYIIGSFESSDWCWNEFGEYQRRGEQNSNRWFEEFRRTLSLALDISTVSEQYQSRSLRAYYRPVLDHASRLLPLAVKEEHPLTVIQMFALLNHLTVKQSKIQQRLLLCLRYWAQHYNFSIFHPFRLIFYHTWELLMQNEFNSRLIRSLVPRFCKAFVDSFVEGSCGNPYSVDPFLVEYLTQTNIYDPNRRQHLEEELRSLCDYYSNNDPLSHEVLQLSYWWLKFTEHFSFPQESILRTLSEILQQCSEHTKICPDRSCWLAERGYFAAYETRARMSERQSRFQNAISDWERAIDHRMTYDQIQGRRHSPGAIVRMLRQYACCMDNGFRTRGEEVLNTVLQYLRQYE